MTPETAIEDLQARIDGEFSIKGVDDCADIKLGIEALKAILSSRTLHGYSLFNPLPGETED